MAGNRVYGSCGAGALAAALLALAAPGGAEYASAATTGPDTQSAASKPASEAGKPAAKDLLDHVQDSLRTVETVEADFVQEKTLAMFAHTVTISGHFAMQKPSRLIWIVLKPVRYAVRIEGGTIHQWDQDTNHVQVIELGGDPVFKAVLEQIQAWFMGDYKVLAQTFDVDVLSEKPLVLGFTPKADSAAGKVLKHIDMTFGKDETYIDNIAVVEVGGDVTKLKFITPKLNEKIKPETWEIPPRE